MIKLAGFIIILFSAVKIGYDISQKYINRTQEVKNLINVFDFMCKELNFTTPDLAEMFGTAAKVNCKNIKKLFEDISGVMKNKTITPLEAFNVCKNNIDFSLNNNDFQILSDYFSVCGSGCVNDEVNSIKKTIFLLDQNLESAIADENKYVKLYRFTGLIVGLMVSIILI